MGTAGQDPATDWPGLVDGQFLPAYPDMRMMGSPGHRSRATGPGPGPGPQARILTGPRPDAIDHPEART